MRARKPAAKTPGVRGRPARLSRDAIADAALSLIGSGALSGLTMRTLAERLGASPMAVYKHVAGRDELELLVVERSFASLVLPPLELPPVEWLARVARDVRAIGLAYPGVMDYLLEHGPVAQATLRILDHTVTMLHAVGLSYREAGELHNTFFSWLAGAVRRQCSAQNAGTEAFGRFIEAARALPAASFPGLHQSLPHMQRGDFDREFATSLTFMLDAIALRIERASA